MGKREHAVNGRKGFQESVTAQLALMGKVGESEVHKGLPGQEVPEPEAFGGESKARVPHPPASESPDAYDANAWAECSITKQNSGMVSRSLHF